MDSASNGSNQDWHILSPKGKFTSVYEAAEAEAKIDWNVEENQEQEACTLSFAGKEIKDLNGNTIGYDEIYITDAEVIRLVGEKSAVLKVSPGYDLQLPLFCKTQ